MDFFEPQRTEVIVCNCELRNNSFYKDTYNECIDVKGRNDDSTDILILFEQKERDWMTNEFTSFLKKLSEKEKINFKIIYALNCGNKNITPDKLRPFLMCKKEHVKKNIEKINPKIIITSGKAIYTITENKYFRVSEEKKQGSDDDGDSVNQGGNFYSLHEDDRFIYSSEFKCNVYPIPPLYKFAGFDNYEKKFTKGQFDLAIKTLKNNNKKRFPKITYELVKDPNSLIKDFINNKSINELSVDIETTGLDWKTDLILSVQLTHNLKPFHSYFLYWSNVDVELLVELFNREDIEFIYQGGDFDCKFFKQNSILNALVDFDTMIASHSLNENSPNGLKPLAWIYTCWGGYENKLKKYKEENNIKDYSEIPEDILVEYACYDSVITFYLKKYFEKRFKKEHDCVVYDFYNYRMPAVNMNIDVGMRGMPVDVKYLYEYSDKLKQKANDIEQEIYDIAGRNFNLSSKKELSIVFKSLPNFIPLKDERGKPLLVKSGDLKLNKDCLNAYAEKGYDFAKKIIEYDHCKKEISQLGVNYQINTKNTKNDVVQNDFFMSVVEEEIEEEEEDDLTGKGIMASVIDNRLYAGTKLHGTKSGRPSSGGGIRSNVNLLNFPKAEDFRKIFLPRTGYIFGEIDYSSLEVSIQSQIAGKGSLEDLILQNKDMHVFTCNSIYEVMGKEQLDKLLLDEYDKNLILQKKYKSKGKERKDIEQILKDFNYSYETIFEQSKIIEEPIFKAFRQMGKITNFQCFSADTCIITNKGILPLGDIVSDLQDGTFVKYNSDLKVLQRDNSFADISHTIYKQDSELLEIEMEDGSFIKVTPDHIMKVIRKGKELSLEANNLIEGDDLVFVLNKSGLKIKSIKKIGNNSVYCLNIPKSHEMILSNNVVVGNCQYGSTGYGLANSIGMSNELGQTFLDAYFKSFPEVKNYIDNTLDFFKENGYNFNMIGRKRRVPRLMYPVCNITNKSREKELKDVQRESWKVINNAKNSAFNGRVQGTSGEVTLKAMTEINNDYKKLGFKSQILNTVYDSIVFEFYIPELEQAIDIATKHMIKPYYENIGNNKIKLKVDTELGAVWGFGKSPEYWKEHTNEWEDILKHIEYRNNLNKKDILND